MSLPTRWLGTMVMTSSAKYSGKTTILPGPTNSGVIKISFAGLTMLNKPFKGKLTISFEGATPAP